MSKISLTMGNQATFIIKLKRGNESFPVEDSTDVRVRLIHNEEAMVCTPSINVGEVMINVPAMRCVGTFGVEVTGVYNGARWRTYGAEVIEYTYDTRVGDSSVTVAGDDFEVSMEVQLYVSEVTPSSVATQEWVIEQGYAKSADLADVATSGNYNDLINTPTIPAEQVNADWNATTGKAEILNKPTIPAAQVNSDWDAESGVAQILNKPTLFSGDYNDLSNKPTIPAAQVNSDWNANSGVAEILNKPTLFSGDYADLTNKPNLATVATSGSYNDLTNKPSIPSAQVQSNWNETDTASKAYIQNKPTIPDVSGKENTSNKVTSLSSSSTDTQYPSAKCVFDALTGKENNLYIGTLTNWGQSSNNCYLRSAYFLDGSIPQKEGDLVFSRGTGCLHRCGAITYDSNVGAYKTNPTYLAMVLVSHQNISGKEDKMSIVAGSGTTLSATVNTAYTFASAVGTLAVTLPVPSDTSHVNTIVFWFTTDASPAVTFTSTNTVYFHDGYELEASSTYEVNAAYNGSNWIISSIKIATS